MRIVTSKLGGFLLACLLILTMVVGFTCTADEGEPEPFQTFTHAVLAEELTGTWCQYCPAAAEQLNNVYTSGDYPFYFVALIEDEVQKADDRCSDDFNVGGYPTVHFDGGYESVVGAQYDEEDYRAAIESCGDRAVPDIDIEVTAYDTGPGVLEISVNITNNEDAEYTGHLRTYITEIVSRYINYDGDPYHFGFLDYAFDVDVVVGANSFWYNEVTWIGADHQDLSGDDFGDIDPANILVIASVFNDEPNPKIQPDIFIAYYTDETAATIVTQAPVYGVELTPPTQTHTISAGESTIYSINVENTGDTEDTYTLTISGEHSDWGSLSEGWPTLPPGSSQGISLEVSVPPGTADGSYDIDVTATSNNDPSTTSTVSTTTDVTSVVTYGVHLSSGQTAKTTHPGESVIYTITVENTGNTDDTIDITKSGANSHWGTLSQSSVFLSSGDSEDITLTVDVPSDASGGDYPIFVKGTSQGNPSFYDEITLTTTVEPYIYDVDLEPENQDDSVEKGDNVEFTINVKNTGNVQEIINLTIYGSNFFWASLSDYNLDLEIGGDQNVILTIDVPSNADAEEYSFTVIGYCEADSSIHDDVEVSITVTEPNIITITDVTHSPENPTKNDTITVTATVTGDNIQSVNLDYCQGETCFAPVTMQSVGNDQYSGTFGPLDFGSYQYEVRVKDNSGNTYKSGKYDFAVSSGSQPTQDDTDGDGYNDDVDAFPDDPTQWEDSDNDGYGDNPEGNNPDAYPLDPTRHSLTQSTEAEAPWHESETGIFLIVLLVVIIAIVVVLAAVLARPKKQQEQEVISQMPLQVAQPLEQPMPEPVFTPYTPEVPQTEDISCPGCSQVFEIPFEPRPLPVMCPSCGLKGVID